MCSNNFYAFLEELDSGLVRMALLHHSSTRWFLLTVGSVSDVASDVNANVRFGNVMLHALTSTAVFMQHIGMNFKNLRSKHGD